jgi:hypothetical protein
MRKSAIFFALVCILAIGLPIGVWMLLFHLFWGA